MKNKNAVSPIAPFPYQFLPPHAEARSRAGVLTFLRAWRALLANPSSWTHGVYARDAASCPCEVDGPKAASWCLTGAAAHVAGVDPARLFAVGAGEAEPTSAQRMVAVLIAADPQLQDDLKLEADTVMEADLENLAFLWEKIMVWNDARGTSHNDVLRVLDAAIAREEAKLA